jgi:C-lobe and N-lobe beta barrels of Tf-binding protein B
MRNESAVAMLAIVALAACGGGPVCCVNGSPTGGVSPFISFRAFNEAPASVPVRAPAVSTGWSSGSRNGPEAATFDLTLDHNHTPTLLGIESPSRSASWSGEEIRCSGARCALDNGSDVGTFLEPGTNGWNYQTFGYWISPSAGTTAMSMGNPTPPTTALALSRGSYTGTSSGLYFNGSSTYEHSSQMRAEVDFGARTIDFSTSGTHLSQSGSSFSVPAAQLDMTGSLAISDGYQFSGPVRTRSFFFGVFSFRGTATGTFYGPQAEEIGGVYTLSPSTGGTARVTGGFGGSR